jgi:N-acetylmuramoyl-L-alanine amidase
MKIENHRLVLEGENFATSFVQSPNFSGTVTPEYLIIHATGGPLTSTINWFKKAASTSTHLIIDDQGQEIVQMVDFNRRAVHAHTYNSNAIGIELVYPSYLLETDSFLYRFIGSYPPEKIFEAHAQNDWRMRNWPSYHPAQLDALVEVSKTLIESLGIEKVIRHEDVNSGKMDPGPMFPMVTFREQLLGKREILLEETNRLIQLRTRPDMSSQQILAEALPKGTAVAVVGEKEGWVQVEVMQAVDGNPWLIGWIPAAYVQVRRFTPVVKDHRLGAEEGGLVRFEEPHPANYGKDEPIQESKYLIMHVTTGTTMQGVVNHFKNPGSGVSAHLLIGRDGRIIQFVPLDRVAYHSGLSYWEGDENLNKLSIGIELDNAADLSGEPGSYTKRGVPIPDSQVQRATHWKSRVERGWHKFTPIQLEVALQVAKALKEHYGLEEILGHDVVNLKNRMDPGPLFPMKAWRLEIFDREEPAIQLYRVKEPADIYEHLGSKAPNPNHPSHGTLSENCMIQMRDEMGDWLLVRPLVGNLSEQVGWVEKKNIKVLSSGKMKTNTEVQLFVDNDGPPLRQLSIGQLDPDAQARIQVEQGPWALVANPVMDTPQRWIEGWVLRERLEEIE